MKRFNNLRGRLLGGVFLLVFVMITAVSITISYYLTEQRKEEAEKYLMEKAANTANQLDVVISRLDAVSSQLLASKTLQRMFVMAQSKNYEDRNYFDYNIEDRKTAQDVLWTFNSPQRQIENINIFSESTYVGLRYAPAVTDIQAIAAQEQWNISEDQKYRILSPHKDKWNSKDPKEVISLVRPFIATNFRFRQVGTIEVQEQYRVIEEACSLSENDLGMDVLVLDQNGVSIYQSRRYTTEERRQYSEQMQVASEETIHPIRIAGQAAMEVHKGLKNTRWTVMLTQQTAVFRQPVQQILAVMVLASLAIAVIVFLILRFLIHGITKPVLVLASDMDEMHNLDQMPVLHASKVQEVQVLQNKYLEMMERMKESRDELILANETELQLRILGLQEQVNPHFLFNSLTAVSAVSMEEGGRKVPIMCYQLSELFRYSSDTRSEVSLQEEVDYVRTYLTFMKWRYESNFEFEIEEVGDSKSYRISRMAFQPLAENCFTHGFKESMPPYRLRISLTCSEEGWNFCIADNGTGFRKEVMAKISEETVKIDQILESRQNYQQLKTENMALLNGYIRLKLWYRNGLKLSIDQDPELHGARIQITAKI